MHGDQRNFSKTLFPRWLKEELKAQSRVGNPEMTVGTKLKQTRIMTLVSPHSIWSVHIMVSGKGRMRDFFVVVVPTSQAFDSVPREAYIVYLIKRHPQKRKVSQISIHLRSRLDGELSNI